MQELLLKYLTGELNQKEKEKITNWLKTPGNQKRFKNLKTLWLLMDDYKSNFQPDLKHAWGKLDQRIQRTKARRLYIRVISSAAAVLLIFLSIWTLLPNKNMVTIYADQVKNIVLPDSSTVCLKEGSTLSYYSRFTERFIILNGEAFFEVTKTNNSEFKVEGERSEVVVLGTSFNYKTNRENKTDQLHVLSGKVQFVNKETIDNKVTLTEGEKANLIKEKFEKSEFTDHNFLFYKTRKLSFNNTPLKEIVETVSTCYNEKIIIDGNLMIDSIQISTGFNDESMNEIMNELKIITGLKLEKNGNVWNISKN